MVKRAKKTAKKGRAKPKAKPKPKPRNPTWVKTVLANIAAGHTDKYAYLKAGICWNTLKEWSEKSEENLDRLTRAREARAAKGSKNIQDICLDMARKGSLQHLRMYWRLVDPEGYKADCALAAEAEPDRRITENREGPSMADLITITERGGFKKALKDDNRDG